MKNILLTTILLSTILTSCKKDELPEVDQNPPVIQDTISSDTLSTLIVNVTELQNSNGSVNLALYNTEVDFNNPPTPLREITISAVSPTTTITISGLLPGEYAFAVYHDENSNLEIDQNFLGIPQEGFAFSNNSFGTLSPPSWEQSKFSIEKSTTVTQSVSLIFF